MTWSLWLVVVSWIGSPIWFNPLAFEWNDVINDFRMWSRWMRGDGGSANQSWTAWFKEENAYFEHLKNWAKVVVALKGVVYFFVGTCLLTAHDEYHSILSINSWLPLALTSAMALILLTCFASKSTLV